jgi:hypothetical protein
MDEENASNTYNKMKEFISNKDKSFEDEFYNEMMAKENKLITVLEKMTQNEIKKQQQKKSQYLDKSIREILDEFLETLIFILNDISLFFSTSQKLSFEEKQNALMDIFFRDDRVFYSGILLVSISFILYYIDSSD